MFEYRTCFLQLRGIQLNCDEPHQVICGDFNTTLNTVLDKSGYHTDAHWSSREVIHAWIDREECNCLSDTFRLWKPLLSTVHLEKQASTHHKKT